MTSQGHGIALPLQSFAPTTGLSFPFLFSLSGLWFACEMCTFRGAGSFHLQMAQEFQSCGPNAIVEIAEPMWANAQLPC